MRPYGCECNLDAFAQVHSIRVQQLHSRGVKHSHRQYTVDDIGFSGKDRIQSNRPMPSMPPDTPRRSLHALPPGTVLHDYVIDSELVSCHLSNVG